MSVAFLYPLMWLGALAVGVPLWLHLRRREDRWIVRFSALQFLDHQPLPRQSALRPRDWPLLLLRLVGLLLLVAAFAWPYLPHHQDVLVDESRVYILDNTLSHQAGGGFAAARDEIVRHLSAAGTREQVAVIELTALPRVVTGFADRRAEAIEKVQSLRPSFQRGSYLAAFHAAAGLLGQSLGQRKHIVLLGDSQQNQWKEGERVLPFLENVEVTLPPITRSSRPNLALLLPNAQRVLVDDKPMAECAVHLYHHGEQKSATVVFLADGKEVSRREVPLAGQPESITLLARWEADPARWVHGEVRLDGHPDDFPADDRAFFTLAPVQEGGVELLVRSPFLRTALSPEVMKGRWKIRAVLPAELKAGSADPPEQDVLCLESRYLQVTAVRELVRKYLDQGKGVLLIVDQAPPLVAGVLREFGVQVAAEVEPALGNRDLRYVYTEHPIFQPFRAADFGNLAEIQVHRYRRLQSAEATPLLFSGLGDPLMLELPRGRGRLLVVAFALDRTETNWPVHPTFIPFLDRCLQHARAPWIAPTACEPGETLVWQPLPGRPVTEVVLAKEPSAAAEQAVRAPVVAAAARLPVPDAPGVYAVRYDDRPEIEGLLAVNPSPEESYLVYADALQTVAGWKREPAGSESSATELASLALSRPEILAQHLWWWLLLCGLAALLTETSWLWLRKAWS